MWYEAGRDRRESRCLHPGWGGVGGASAPCAPFLMLHDLRIVGREVPLRPVGFLSVRAR